MKRTILDAAQKWLSRYIDIGEKEDILDGDFREVETETETENVTTSALQERLTQEILNGDITILETYLKQYRNNHKNIDGLMFLFKDNLRLSKWLVDEADAQLLLKFPIEIYNIVDQQLSDNYK